MPKSEKKIELTETQREFLETYWRLEEQLGRGPSIREMAAAHGGYSDHSGAQRMMNKLSEAGLIRLQQLVPGGITDDGAMVLGLKRTGTRRVSRRNAKA